MSEPSEREWLEGLDPQTEQDRRDEVSPVSPVDGEVDVTGVTQTILANDENLADGVYGNCMQAAMATLLGKPLDAVPHFGAYTWWPGAMTLWLRGIGLDMTQIDAPPIPRERALLVGRSPRDNLHMVVSEGAEIVWDPHPTRGGLTEITGAILVHEWETNTDAPCWVCRRSGDDLARLEAAESARDEALAAVERVRALADELRALGTVSVYESAAEFAQMLDEWLTPSAPTEEER